MPFRSHIIGRAVCLQASFMNWKKKVKTKNRCTELHILCVLGFFFAYMEYMVCTVRKKGREREAERGVLINCHKLHNSTGEGAGGKTRKIIQCSIKLSH